MKALILAGGYSTKLYPLTKNTPKALLVIGKKTVLDYIIEQVNKIEDVQEIIIVSNHKFLKQFHEWKATYKGKKPVDILDDNTTSESERLGAIGDIVFSIREKRIDDELLIIAGDNFFTYDLADYYKFYKSKNADCVCAKNMDVNENLSLFGIAVLDENNRIINLEEKPENPKSNTVVYATYFYTKESVRKFKDYFIKNNKKDAPGKFLEWLHKEVPIYAYLFDGECYDIGTPKSYENLCKKFKCK